MTCENNTSRCTREASEEMTSYPMPSLPSLRFRLCRQHSADWASVLAKHHRGYERRSLATGGVVEEMLEPVFQRTARVGRGVAKK